MKLSAGRAITSLLVYTHSPVETTGFGLYFKIALATAQATKDYLCI